MKVGREHTTTRERRVEVGFNCPGCGYGSQATVTFVGRGTGLSPLFLDAEGATARAGARADDAARDEAQHIIELARCPNCGRRNEHAVSSFRQDIIKTIVAIVAVLVPFGALTWLGSPGLAVGACSVLAALALARFVRM